MPPKRSVLCRPPRLLPHSMRLSRRYTDTDRARRTDTERAWSRQYTNTDRAPCSAPSLPPHLVTVSLPLLGARDPRSRRRHFLRHLSLSNVISA
ncbi:hypothetical protein NDU88_009515 [Pleurodeles waltl]|uniref:Uncharacterized protein n=1 Tax=Pleurodeles waltl TaxID=8319 RepID=A0AAV7S184_PLEWA|nr:hypothetical protein NDU88_009515 [Pleurodeles waltl]